MSASGFVLRLQSGTSASGHWLRPAWSGLSASGLIAALILVNDEKTKQWKQRRFWHCALRRQLSVLAGEGCAGLGGEGLWGGSPLANRPLVAVF